MRRFQLCSIVLVVCLSAPLWAQSSNATEIPAAQAAFSNAPLSPTADNPHPAFDVKAAVDAYLAKVPPDKKARSDAYFEGGYWLILWDFIYSVVVMLLLLQAGWSSKMRNFAERITRFRPLQTALYWIQFLLLTTLLQFPLAVYEGYIREHKYGLATQTFGPWMRDQMVGLLLGLVLGGILIMALFGIVRRLGRTWWVWGALVTIIFMAFTFVIGPVFISPLFNKYTKLQDPKIKQSILSMARANGIPVTEVYQVDASRQSTRVSANVSGFLGTDRITLNDNLLKRCTPEEIQAVMGHEMGHYVLHHVLKDVVFFTLVILVGFLFLNWGLNWSLARWGQRWGIRDITDTAVLPLAVIILSVFFLVMTPVINSQIRTEEYEADIFGLNASHQPDGEAEVDLKLGEYRKLDPGKWEERIFFDHPSGRTRITAAMRWKAEHLPINASTQQAGSNNAADKSVGSLPQSQSQRPAHASSR
ncbi:MAG TPA: M48 family metallopeptidase [Terriglobales bacterium]|nr:M48 family metallopeptidase [Terriglobales bacterium]